MNKSAKTISFIQQTSRCHLPPTRLRASRQQLPRWRSSCSPGPSATSLSSSCPSTSWASSLDLLAALHNDPSKKRKIIRKCSQLLPRGPRNGRAATPMVELASLQLELDYFSYEALIEVDLWNVGFSTFLWSTLTANNLLGLIRSTKVFLQKIEDGMFS